MSSAGPDPPSVPGFDHVRLLGSGRFADVHLYQQRFPRRLVAVKIVREQLLTWEAEHAFELEANALAALSTHPCIVAIHDAGRSADGHPYIVMEYCPLPTLSQRAKAEKVDAQDALRIGILLAGAVDTAHAHGILHRDVKPSNVLMTDYGSPKLADFGIASSAWDRNAVSGFTPAWAPPELLSGEESATVASDVYSLAGTVYTLLAGHAPHIRPGNGGNRVEDIVARAESTPVPTLTGTVPGAVAAVFDRALSREPEDRFQTARELGAALQRVQHELGWPTTSMTLVHPPEGTVRDLAATETAGTWPQAGGTDHKPLAPADRGKRRRARRPLALGAAALLVLTAGGSLVADTLRDRGAPTSSSAGPLDVGVPYVNQPCNGRWVLVLASSAQESTWESKLGAAVEGVGAAKYLKNDASCEVFQPDFQGVDIFQAYTGPYDSLAVACTAKLALDHPGSWIRRLRLETTRRDLCFCLQRADQLPVLTERQRGLFPADRSLVSDVQWVLFSEGFNPARRFSGHLTVELARMVSAYKARHHLDANGVVDSDTWVALHEDYCLA